ncbi:programmed cell death protein 5-like isoform X1 [Daphnia pulex]|uniref:programmed cell death protein 5-like isoform X1 n=1 Tax=Daphnia pulex TaxID=6669 RepID=UPI001EDFAF4E|nr:programmed cell death protein 5-like isoform X1 [Daphnia pulex]
MMNCKLSGPKGWLQCANSNNRVKGIQVRYISLTVLLDSGLHFNILQAAQKQEDERKQQEDMKNSILSQVLNQSARARLNTIRIAKPEKAAMVENLLVNMARRGQIGGQLGENELKGLLEQVSQQTKQETTVKFDRRRAALDDEDDD